MPAITITSFIKEKCPLLRLGILQMYVKVEPSSSVLLHKIAEKAGIYVEKYKMEEISKIPLIQQTREAYKALGKKPGRYRPSAEALLRRVVSGKGLYAINNVVDSLNYISIQSGFSIGGYDLDQIQEPIQLSIGVDNEPYRAIARGQLNVGRLPVLRDEAGAFGSPTSDSVRTSVRDSTKRFLMVFFDFSASPELSFWQNEAVQIMTTHCKAENIEVFTRN